MTDELQHVTFGGEPYTHRALTDELERVKADRDRIAANYRYMASLVTPIVSDMFRYRRGLSNLLEAILTPVGTVSKDVHDDMVWDAVHEAEEALRAYKDPVKPV
jgi:hypothetical protein